MAVEKTLVVATNEDLSFSSRWTDEAGHPYALSGAFCQVRSDTDDDPVLDLSVGSGITIEPVTYWAHVHVPASELAHVEPKFHSFDLILERVDGTRRRLVKGNINFERGVTDA